MTTTQRRPPLRAALVDDHAIVVRGLAAMLESHQDRVQVVELDSLRDPVEEVDLILRDAFGMVEVQEDFADFVATANAPVVVFAFATEPEAVKAAMDAGAAGYVYKGVSEERLIKALERVAAGERVVEVEAGSGRPVEVNDEPVRGGGTGPGNWPGRDLGLSERESEILTLICRGITNQEVAESLYLSINSVKTYIRSLYRKIGATSRSQAVIWGLDHGFSPRPSRRRL